MVSKSNASKANVVMLSLVIVEVNPSAGHQQHIGMAKTLKVLQAVCLLWLVLQAAGRKHQVHAALTELLCKGQGMLPSESLKRYTWMGPAGNFQTMPSVGMTWWDVKKPVLREQHTEVLSVFGQEGQDALEGCP